MAGPNQGVNMDQFEAFFQKADLNKDGKITGDEAVGFFQGSNLPKQVLAQIWHHADQGRNGFLGRVEFYNALKLVTVAQSKRELSADIVKAALYGPAAAKIPPPRINLAAIASPQSNTVSVAPITQAMVGAPTASQNAAFRVPAVPNPNANKQYFPSQQIQSTTHLFPAGTASHSSPGLAGLELPRGGGVVGPSTPSANIRAATGMGSPTRGISPARLSSAPTPPNVSHTSSFLDANNSKAPLDSGNVLSFNKGFGGDIFSAKTSSAAKQEFPVPASSGPISSGSLSAPSVPWPPIKSSSLDSLQSAFKVEPSSNQLQHARSHVNLNQEVFAQSSSPLISSGISVSSGNSTSDPLHASWPKITPTDIQKYTKVFVEVDTDRDGRITGEQARNLFLSWRLPVAVLKQVWDLSDQDNDSMLSLREFCIALYLLERYREGRPLPSVLPNNFFLNEALLPKANQSRAFHGNAAWGATSGLRPQQGLIGTQPMMPVTGLRPSLQTSTSQTDGSWESSHQNSTVAMVDNFHRNKPTSDGQNLKSQVVGDTYKKIEARKNEILDSKEKIEFYRTKMQDLVLYKSRCDNRLNEITERASADKREAELLGKKYEEKYKQVAEISSKLAMEEARFRDVRERKMELHQAIIKMQQGGSADGILQVRADRIQSDLEELMKVLAERGKKCGLDLRSTSMIELPTGWLVGVEEGAAEWDEDWDKFEDEGFSFMKDLPPNGQDVMATPKQNSSPLWNEEASADGTSFVANGISESVFDTAEQGDSGSTQDVDDLPHSTHEGSPSQEFSDIHSIKSTEMDAEIHSYRSFDEAKWGAFDTDDADSVWGFNKDVGAEKHGENYLFGSGDPTISETRTDSPSADSIFEKKGPFTFPDSVPGTPLSKPGNSPRFSEASFGNDSFNTGFSPAQETFTRFDSINSWRGQGLPSFDGSESQTPKKASENWSAF